MSSRKRSDTPAWEHLVAKFEAAGSRDLVGFAKAHGVSAMRLQNHWYRIRRKRWEEEVEEQVRIVDVDVWTSPVPPSPGHLEAAPGSPALEFEWAPGLRLRVPAGGDVGAVAQLVGAVTREVCGC